ncbi:MAG: hypothetical protein ABSB89_05250 [Candidatus Bathyarchaeia archaeon]|jgi:hypothetical protein
MSTPLIGRNAVIEMSAGSAVVIGFAQGFTDETDADLIKEFALGSDHAAILASGNKHFKFNIDKMFIDKTYQQYVYGGTNVDIIVAPQGTSSGNQKWTYKSCVLTQSQMKADQKGIIAEKVVGEASDVIIGSF